MAEENRLGSKKSKKRLVMLIILLLLIIIGGGTYMGVAYLKQLPPFEPEGPTPEEIALQKSKMEVQLQQELSERFVTFEQGFTFNLQEGGKPHMMQIEIALMVLGPQNEELAREHLPLISSVISELAGQQSYESLIAQTGRQRLKRLLLEAIRSRLSGLLHQSVVEQVLFTNFVIQ